MRVTALWVYPIKALRGIQVDKAKLGPQGLEHDRRFMLCKVEDSGELTKVQLASHPECALFEQEIRGDSIHVRYLTPPEPLVPPRPEHGVELQVPLYPDFEKLEKAHINLHMSLVKAYHMGAKYDDWFSACFGFKTALVYIGDGRRPVLGTFSPKSQAESGTWQSSSWFSWVYLLMRYLRGGPGAEPDWLTFSDCAPYMVATEASLQNVQQRLADGDVAMYKFRPNIVVDGESQWDEDFWAGLRIDDRLTLALTKNCNRCTSINVDYNTGRIAQGEHGTVLKKLMSDRRVDPGNKYSPAFGRYGFLASDDNDNVAAEDATIMVGESVEVTGRIADRPVWDWPLRDPSIARYY